VRWVILTDDHPPRLGGVSVIVGRLARELAQRGHQVQVCARHRGELVPIEGTALTTSWGPSFGRYGGWWLAARSLRWLLRADRVLASTWPVASALSRLGVPYDLLAHGSDLTRPPRDPALFERVWANAQGRWAMSEFLVSQLQRRGFSASVLPAPVPIAPSPAPAGRGWALVARGTPLKGGDRFVRCLAAAGVPGIVIGSGPELPRWQQLARELGAEVHFAGPQPEPQLLALLRPSALCALLPRPAPDGTGAEGFGLALVEAAGQGVPALGCRTGGVPEAVGPGLIVEAPDSPEAVASAVRRWWSPQRGEEAWRWCREHHGVERAVDKLGR
jgi:glycosyltransferase involved in cell wall biosynthesis